MRTYSRRGRLPRGETQSCGDVGAAKNTAAPGEDDFSSEDAGPPTAFRMTIFPDGNREEKSFVPNEKLFRV